MQNGSYTWVFTFTLSLYTTELLFSYASEPSLHISLLVVCCHVNMEDSVIGPGGFANQFLMSDFVLLLFIELLLRTTKRGGGEVD